MPRVMARAAQFAGRTVTFGESAGAIGARAPTSRIAALTACARASATPAGERVIETPLLGRGNLANVLAATAVALEFGIAARRPLPRAPRRCARRTGAAQSIGCAAASRSSTTRTTRVPSALQRALDVIANESRASRKVAVLGEMLELGDHATELHREQRSRRRGRRPARCCSPSAARRRASSPTRRSRPA